MARNMNNVTHVDNTQVKNSIRGVVPEVFQASGFTALRNALLISAAVGTLVFASSSFARAQNAQTSPVTPPAAPCDKGDSGSRTAICEGDVSSGVEVKGTDYDKLVVRKLTEDIAPEKGKDGVRFDVTDNRDIEISVDTGGYQIITREKFADAIESSSSSSGSVAITYSGDGIETDGEGANGIEGKSSGSGSVTINHISGNINTKGVDAHGIFAGSKSGSVNITHNGGNIKAEGGNADGIQAGSGSGNVTITHNGGNIEVDGEDADAIDVHSTTGAATIILNGKSSIISNNPGGTGIEISGSGKNTLTINGETTVSGGKYDIEGKPGEPGEAPGSEIINNSGIFTSFGIIDLGEGNNAFNNAVGALFNSGAEVRLGAGNLFTNAGELSPAGTDAVGTTEITGNYIQKSTGTYTVTIDPSIESGSQADFLDIAGRVTLDGRLKVVPVPNIPVESQLTRYTVMQLRAGKPAGEFTRIANVNVPLDRLSYDEGGNVYLDLSGIRSSDLAMLDEDMSSSIIPSVHGALISHAQGNVDLINARLQIADADDAGEAGVMGLSSNAMQSNRDSRFWASVQGTRGKHEAVSLSPELKSRQTGLALGFDQQVSENLRLGIMASHVRGDFDQNVGNASGRDKTFSLGAYGSARVSSSSPLRIGFGGLYNWHRPEGSRTPEETGVSLSSSHKAHSWQLFGGASYRVDMSNDFSLEPFAGLSHMNFKSDPFTETGGDGALRASSSSRGTTFSTLGVRGRVKVDDTIRVYGMAGWRRAFGKVVPSVGFSHVNGPSSPFMISGSPIARNSALVQVGASFALSSDTSLSASYTGQYAKKIRTHGANVRLSVKF